MISSLLGKLPAELRNAIYEYSLLEGDNGPETIYLGRGSHDDHLTAYLVSDQHGSSPLHIHGLPAVCRQLRWETLPVYYSINRFCIQTEYLKSDQKGEIIEQIQKWVQTIGHEQAREMRHVTISLASFKGQQSPAVSLSIDWNHMRQLRQLFHPRGRLDIRFFLAGSKTATFRLESRRSTEEQLNRMAELWCARWQKTRKYSELEAKMLASLYTAEIAKLFVDMPDSV
ncbi:hypothetical protein CERZMDRAFT_93641 [Cercospora zeae-maydis SCOH1-5]|uniref:F-box domain-containing protein n=1 Tax=Cercospora zeae-maydis SCOH1-5 TaxID=717836 RepID=A0A6A6FS87_9PEZI|nr:hypothetical protein CERZMDRAFT_93641 [Cercospora zeae-maydis SCOH1-5]